MVELQVSGAVTKPRELRHCSPKPYYWLSRSEDLNLEGILSLGVAVAFTACARASVWTVSCIACISTPIAPNRSHDFVNAYLEQSGFVSSHLTRLILPNDFSNWTLIPSSH